jgi:peroxiredoxin
MPPEDDYAKGPEVGEALPDFTLPDQHGRMVNFSKTRGEGRALVMFHRSARW